VSATCGGGYYDCSYWATGYWDTAVSISNQYLNQVKGWRKANAAHSNVSLYQINHNNTVQKSSQFTYNNRTTSLLNNSSAGATVNSGNPYTGSRGIGGGGTGYYGLYLTGSGWASSGTTYPYVTGSIRGYYSYPYIQGATCQHAYYDCSYYSPYSAAGPNVYS
jgi:hypothetical protein